MVFDTTYSNTGHLTAACIAIQGRLRWHLLWSGCRHQVGELIILSFKILRSRRQNHQCFQCFHGSAITLDFYCMTVVTGDAIISSFDRNNHSEEAGEYLSECKDAVLQDLPRLQGVRPYVSRRWQCSDVQETKCRWQCSDVQETWCRWQCSDVQETWCRWQCSDVQETWCRWQCSDVQETWCRWQCSDVQETWCRWQCSDVQETWCNAQSSLDGTNLVCTLTEKTIVQLPAGTVNVAWNDLQLMKCLI